jgi:hypothetical protein
VRFAPALIVWALLCLGLPDAAHAQEAAVLRTNTFPTWQPSSDVLVRPDSVRRKVGYQHWKGGAIGGSVGALAGLLLAVLAPRGCYDCTSNDSGTLEATLIGAGLGGAFGFLVGAASPKYRWEAQSADSLNQ